MKKANIQGLVASGVLLACAQLHAATLTVAPTVSSSEGNAAAALTNGAASITLPNLTFRPSGTGYVDGDIVTITFAGGTVRASSLGVVDTATILCRDAVPNTVMTLTLKSVSGGTSTWQVARNISTTAVNLTTCALNNVEVLRSSLTGTNVVSVNWSAATSGGTVHDVLRGYSDEGSPASARAVHLSVSQFAADSPTTVSNPNARLIAPFQSASSGGTRQRFTTGATQTTTSTSAAFTLTYSSDGSYNGTADATEISTAGATLTATYTGDFSFIDSDSNGCTVDDFTRGWGRLTVTATAGTVASSVAITSDCTRITTVGTGDRTEVLTFSVANTTADNLLVGVRSAGIGVRSIAEQSIAVVGTWTNGTTTLGTASPVTDAPSLTVDAFSAEIPYMPYGSGISRIIYVTNRSLTAPVKFTARDEAGVFCASTNFPAVSARGSSVTLLSTAIDAGVAACYGANWTGKVRISVIMDIPRSSDDTYASTASLSSGATSVGASTSITEAGTVRRSTARAEIYSAYNVSGNRVTVTNTSNGR